MLKKLYDRCVKLARHKFSKPLLGFVAFIESFFFPVPPDLMIVPMVVAKREDYLKIFLIATVGSVLGGLFGYMLGVFFFICLFTRGLRFFLVSYFTNLFGKKFGDFIEKKGAIWFTITGIFVVVLAVALYIFFR